MDVRINMAPLSGPATCECGKPAEGIVNGEASCRPCEADRLAMIALILGAASDEPESEQVDLFGGTL